MSATYPDLVNPILHGLGPVAERKPSSPGDVRLPADIEVISADNHWEVTEDIYVKGFPAHLKDRAPRIWFDSYWRFGMPGIKEAQGISDGVVRLLSRGLIQTAWNHDVRRPHLEQEGITAEVAFPNNLLGYIDPDPEVREWIFRIYNEHIAEQHDKNPSFYGVGIVSNWWDPGKIQGAFDQIKELGLKAAMVPSALKNGENKDLSFADPILDPFYEALTKLGIPLCLHVGEPTNFVGRGAIAAGALNAFAPFRKPISQLVFGGVFDRHPDVRCVFVEGGISWVLPWLQDAEAIYDTYGTLLDPINHRPGYYWRHNCYATFQTDDLGLRNLDVLGEDRVMWAADYPHSEGTFGVNWKVMESVLKTVGHSAAKKILGGTAKEVFKL
jgi:predicted TIM-barrel fold metal-dependent hydrolase